MNYHRKIIGIFAIVLMLGLTSCIDLLNEITINKDKSGTAFVGIKVNGIAGLINLDNDLLDKDVKNSIVRFPSQSASRIEGIEGISKVETYTKLVQGKLGVQFNFKNQKALNQAYYSLLGEEKKWFYPKMVKVSTHKVKIRNMSPFIKRYFEENDNLLSDNDLLKYLNYTTVIHLPSKVKDDSFNKGKLSKDGKTLSYSINMKKILEEDAACGNSMKY